MVLDQKHALEPERLGLDDVVDEFAVDLAVVRLLSPGGGPAEQTETHCGNTPVETVTRSSRRPREAPCAAISCSNLDEWPGQAHSPHGEERRASDASRTMATDAGGCGWCRPRRCSRPSFETPPSAAPQDEVLHRSVALATRLDHGRA